MSPSYCWVNINIKKLMCFQCIGVLLIIGGRGFKTMVIRCIGMHQLKSGWGFNQIAVCGVTSVGIANICHTCEVGINKYVM